MEDMCIHETHFGRTEPHFDALKLHVLPKLFSQKSGQKVRIASIGCSSGEEPYSIAMTVCESFPPERRDCIEITGLDLSHRILDAARAALYSDFQLRDLDANRRQRWFTQEGNLWSVKPELRRMVRFHQHNLMDPLPMTAIDVIFCRNVMIYFKRPIVERILREYYQAMNPGGFLFLGHAESAFDFSNLFQAVTRISDAVIYQRSPAKMPSATSNEISNKRGEETSNL
jgi:chemotaxis protein methyltransferase CheR